MNPRASVTAEIMAMHRAVEMLFPEEERVCEDRLAVRFLSPEWAALLKDRDRLIAFAGEAAKRLPGINGAVVARVRFLDELVAQAAREGLAQLVILGAGYDTRAYRIAGIENTRVFEADDSVTQRVKMQKMEEILGKKPAHVAFVPVEFTKGDLGARLREGDFDPAKRTLFIMEGLSFYLPPETFDAILAFIAEGCGPQSTVAFDYLPPEVIDGTCERPEAKNSRTEVAGYGEPYRFGLESGKAAAFLAERGLDLKRNVNAPDCRDLYFRGKSRLRQITPIFWFAYAKAKAQG